MAQRYIPEIRDGDKRVLVIGGKVVPYCLARIPKAGETRGNLAAGGTGIARPLSARDAVHVAVMRRRGVARLISFDAGFDQVGGIERMA